MSNLEKTYRQTREYGEILRLLQSAETESEHFVWQNSDTGRTVMPLKSLEIDFVGRDLIIRPEYDVRLLKRNAPLYIKLSVRGAVFKLNRYEITAREIRAPFPDDVRTEELRKEKRVIFGEKANKTVTLKTFGGTSKDNLFKVKLLDLSSHGLGLKVSESNAHFFKGASGFSVIEVDGRDLLEPIDAIVAYFEDEAKPWSMQKSNRSHRVGLRLLQGLLS